MGRTLFECEGNGEQVLRMNKSGAKAKFIVFWTTKTGREVNRAILIDRDNLADLRDAIDDYLAEGDGEATADE